MPFFSQLRTMDGHGHGPLYLTRSVDQGRSWSQPVVFDSFGKMPQLLTLDNGVTLATFGAEVYGNVASTVPVLNVATTGTNSVVVSWTAILGNFQLQQNTDLTTQNWTSVTNAPLLFGGQNLVTLPAAGNGFFRLVQP